ncbi:TIM barrel protein [Saccharibacillus alkalitolerans]|uniref:Sugar phosphate isomerase/epimerase n=1 Tax=Saccharibacillus alkalitolerans TaxID=2705290 RepID=A0ABX0F589_9BACL|nr:sugar phosphate isomerase/epimerase [Saccharibacillus alkalitolerans]NGZ74366.1 sugar phosphate isomerase/epimerase [Saccharibacillus alkalitolerans]
MRKGIRLKGGIDDKSFENRLKYDPEIVELYLTEQDMERTPLIRERIRAMNRRGIGAYMHHPSRYRGAYLDIGSEDPRMRTFYRESTAELLKICEEEGARCVIHAHYVGMGCASADREATIALREEIRSIPGFDSGLLLWEDSTEGLFCYSNPYLIDDLIVPLNLPLNVDVSHTFIGFRGDNDKLCEVLERTAPYARYYHLVDSMGERHDSLPLGEGRIDWVRVKPYVEAKDFIFEINLTGDHTDCSPMVDSAAFFATIGS